MAALTYSRMLGKTVAFALALFRHGYAAGRALDAEETLLLAGAAAEVHPRALLAAVGQRGTGATVAEAARRRPRARGDRRAGDRPGRRPRADRSRLPGGGRVLARDAYRLNVTRGGRGPAFLSLPGRIDRVEVVAVADGETIFHWDLDAGARPAARARPARGPLDARRRGLPRRLGGRRPRGRLSGTVRPATFHRIQVERRRAGG